jgi:hypothetical protein
MDTKREALGFCIPAIVFLSIFTLNCVLVSAAQSSYSIEIDPTAAVVKGDLPTGIFGDLNIPNLTQGEGEFDANISKFFVDPETGIVAKDIRANIGDDIAVYIIGVLNVTYFDLFAPNDTEIYLEDRQSDALLNFLDGVLQAYLVNDSVYFICEINCTVVECGDGVNQALIEARCIDEGGNITDRIVLAADDATITVPCQAPGLTPTGLIALVSLLSAIAAVAIVRKRR